MSDFDPKWVYDPDEDAYFSEVLGAAVPVMDDGGPQIKNWSMWTRWFHTGAGGIGNNMHMWWPSIRGEHSAWILCDRCGLPFALPTGFWLSTIRANDKPWPDVVWTGGPCPRCKNDDGVIATGTPIVFERTDDQGRTVWAGSRETADMAWDYWRDVTEGLGRGEVSLRTAVGRLRSEGGPMSRVADWLESRPITTAAASVILGAIVQTAGPLAFRPDQPADDTEQIVKIIDTVLDHYDRTHPPTDSAPVAPASPDQAEPQPDEPAQAKSRNAGRQDRK